MIRWLMNRVLARFEREWNYDASYLRDMIAADPSAVLAFAKLTGLGRYRRDVPPAVYHAVAIAGTMAEDCGPCTQLTVDRAEREGVAPAVLRAIVAKDIGAMPQEVALGLGFADLTLRHAPEADAVREEIVRRWGRRALISLTFALVAARLFPTAKYALGHGRACRRLTIAGQITAVVGAAGRAA